MQVWHWQDGKSETCIGSVTLHGEDLVSFLEGHGSVQEDDDLFEDYDEDDATGIATHRSFTLQASQSLPRETQALYSDIKGRIILRGRSKRCESESLTNTSHGVTRGQLPTRNTEKRKKRIMLLTQLSDRSHEGPLPGQTPTTTSIDNSSAVSSA